MKWMIAILCAALVLIGLGFVITGSSNGYDLSSNPEATELCNEGIAHENAFRFEEAIIKLDQALELDPMLVEAIVSKAKCQYALGNVYEFSSNVAIADSLANLLENDERRMITQLRLSDYMQSTHRTHRDSLLIELKNKAPENIYVLIADIASKENTAYETQVKAWKHILEIDPDFASAYNQLGYLELHNANFDAATEYLQKYAFLAPKDANPHDSLGEVLMIQGRYEEAEKQFRKAITKQPRYQASIRNLARIYVARGQIRAGLDILNQLRAEQTSVEIKQEITRDTINLMRGVGMDDISVSYIDTIMTNYPDEIGNGIYRAIKLAVKKDFDLSTAVFDSSFTHWSKMSRYESRPHFKRNIDENKAVFYAIVADLRGTPAERIEHWTAMYKGFIQDRPFFKQRFAKYSLAKAYADNGQPEEALALLDTVLEINPRLIRSLILSVECYIQLELTEKAEEALGRLKWCISRSDLDFVAREDADRLSAVIATMAGQS